MKNVSIQLSSHGRSMGPIKTFGEWILYIMTFLEKKTTLEHKGITN
jgi:hypothetical protein